MKDVKNEPAAAAVHATPHALLSEADAVILAAGDFPSHEKPLSLLHKYSDRVICCDGAADELAARGFAPLVIVGDGDSISGTLRERFADRFFCEREQEDNDLTKSVRYAVSRGMERLVILGATGRREDHTLGNISLLADYMDAATVEMWTDHGVLFPVSGDVEINVPAGRQVSFFCMDSSPLTLSGVRWPLENKILSRWWQATLNETVSDTIHVKTEGKIVVFVEYQR